MPVTQNIAPVTISFSNTSQGDGLSYLWNFGDGGTSTDANPTHTFNAGAWEVTLTVTNENGTDVSSAVIVATQPAPPPFVPLGPDGEALPAGFNAGSMLNMGNQQQQQQQQQEQQQNSNSNQGPPPGVFTGGAGGFRP